MTSSASEEDEQTDMNIILDCFVNAKEEGLYAEMKLPGVNSK
jgi:hypothetical protein